MSTHAHEVLAPDPPKPLDVQVTCDPEGGWWINAFRDGSVVATRHSDDWHRVERLRRELAAGSRPHSGTSAGARSAHAMAETR